MVNFKHGMLKPLFKGAKRARYDICIYLYQGHFYGIKNLNSFLGLLIFNFLLLNNFLKAALDAIV